MSAGEIPSKTQVTKAGKCIRRWLTGQNRPGEEVGDLNAALAVLIAFRAAHAGPLRKANMGLRSMVKTAGAQVEVSQRLKRIPTIADKLVREPTMALGNMGDIGGCRAVLDSIDEVRRVEARLKKNRPPVDFHDYITHPKPSGYRAVHLVVVYDERRIEVQLRTKVMHEWAFTVERVSGRLEGDVKSGRGPVAVQDWFKAVSEAMALEETGQTVDETMLKRVWELRDQAEPYLGSSV